MTDCCEVLAGLAVLAGSGLAGQAGWSKDGWAGWVAGLAGWTKVSDWLHGRAGWAGCVPAPAGWLDIGKYRLVKKRVVERFRLRSHEATLAQMGVQKLCGQKSTTLPFLRRPSMTKANAILKKCRNTMCVNIFRQSAHKQNESKLARAWSGRIFAKM